VTATATLSATPASGAAQPLYRLHPKQKEAMRLLGLDHRWSSPYGWAVEEMLYGGEAGGGKSLLARAVAFTLAHIWPGARIPIFRRTYPELEDTHILKVMTEWRGTGYYHGGTHEWRFHNGSAVPFRHCEREADVYRYFSAEWEGLIIDEATQFTEFQITTLRSRVRATRPRWRPLILYTANPGGVGHAFFKEHFVDASAPGKPFMGPPLAKPNEQFRRCFLRARLDDNPSLSKADYDRVLAGISDTDLRRALREGDWNIFSGQMFRWRPEDHVCEPFAIPDSWFRRYVTVDWGFGAPWATYFLVRDEDAWRRDNITRWYAYQEFYSPGVRDQQQARLIRDQMESDNLFRARTAPKLVWDAVADPSMWNQSSQTGLSPADIYHQTMVPIMPANNDRVNGWQRVRQYLARQADQRAALVFFTHCENAIRTIRNLSRNRTHPEDADTHAEDHAADAIRYFCMTQAALEVPDDTPESRRYGMDSGPQAEGRGDPAVVSGKAFERALAAAQGRVTRRRAG
jgi:phage terminase large subunit